MATALNPRPLEPEPQRRRFGNLDRIGLGIGTVQGRWYRHVESDAKGHVLEPETRPGHREFFTHEQIAAFERTKGWRYSPRWYSPRAVSARQVSRLDGLQFIPKRELAAVMRRSTWVEEMTSLRDNGIPLTDANLQKLIADKADEVAAKIKAEILNQRVGGKVKTDTLPSVRSLWRWLAAYEDGGCQPEALRPKYHQIIRRLYSFAPEIEALIIEHVREYASEKRPTQAAQYRQLKAAAEDLNEKRILADEEPFKAPCLRTFQKRINCLPAFDVYAGKHGVDAAMKKFAFVTTGLDVTYPGQRIEIDHWEMQLQTILIRTKMWEYLDLTAKKEVLRQRWYLCAAIDAASLCILGLQLTNSPLTESAIATLAMVVSDKQHIADAVGSKTPWNMRCGIQTVAADMGSEFVSDPFRFAVSALGASLINPPAGLAQMRARIERVFGIFDSQFLSYFTGRTFSDTRDRGSYPAEQRASISFEQLGPLLVRYVTDVYHNHQHESLRGETPFNAWQRLSRTYGTVPPPDGDTRRHIFGLGLKRTVTPQGIRVLNTFYQSTDLHDFFLNKGFGQEIDLKFDPADMGAISVQLEGKYITVPAMVDEFEGVPAQTWIAAQDDLRRRFGEEAKISEPVALAAIRDIRQSAFLAETQANIGPTLLSVEEIDWAEGKLKIAWKSQETAATGGDDNGDILSDLVLPADTPIPPSSPSEDSDDDEEPNTGRQDSKRGWGFED